MSRVKQPQNESRTMLTALLTPIEQELADVDRRLQAELRHPDPWIDQLAQHSFRIGGKRLRPALLLLSAQAVGKICDAHLTLATVAEMIHTATLVHDDVLDEATIRRHEKTINARWNNQTSVLLGDYLFTHAFYLASTLETTYGCRRIGRATNILCEGELRQTASSGNFWLEREQYLQIIDAKTAELCACCCQLGVHYAGGDQTMVRQMAAFGRNLGIAFQIADDLLDLEGEEQTAGKSLGTDLAKRKMTLPLILLRDQLPEADQTRLQTLLQEPDSSHTALLLDWLERTGALQQARHVAVQYSRNAAQNLDQLPESPAQAVLLELTRFVVNRSS